MFKEKGAHKRCVFRFLLEIKHKPENVCGHIGTPKTQTGGGVVHRRRKDRNTEREGKMNTERKEKQKLLKLSLSLLAQNKKKINTQRGRDENNYPHTHAHVHSIGLHGGGSWVVV